MIALPAIADPTAVNAATYGPPASAFYEWKNCSRTFMF
jgi:hypothetical protein